MTTKVTRSILSAKFGNIDLLKPRSHDFNLQRIDLIHGAGADVWMTTIHAEGKFWHVVCGFDDANSVAALAAAVDTQADLVVKDLNTGSRVAGRQWTWSKASMMDVSGAERFAAVGEFAAVFFIPSVDGAVSPLAIVEY